LSGGFSLVKKTCGIVAVGLVTSLIARMPSSQAAEPKINLAGLLSNRVPILPEFGWVWRSLSEWVTG
jgi:hypothetical protein